MKMRLVLLENCNRSCEGCCNKGFDFSTYPKLVDTDTSRFDTVFLTGGEPMLKPELVISMAAKFRAKKVVLYTAWNKPVELLAMAQLLDGITLTLHTQDDVVPFLKLNRMLLSAMLPTKSLRLNVFKEAALPGSADLHLWDVKVERTWIDNCPVPSGEELIIL